MKMAGKDEFILKMARAVQKNISDKKMNEVITGYYMNAINLFVKRFKEWRKYQKENPEVLIS
jgi:hypothetical protein